MVRILCARRNPLLATANNEAPERRCARHHIGAGKIAINQLRSQRNQFATTEETDLPAGFFAKAAGTRRQSSRHRHWF
ncbi:MAG: hypothetical protein KC457_23970, partial [Myxococcales bacterium]|nr:hypothetical protein [Myxococcales bacterium]